MEVIGQLYSVELVEFRNKFTQKDFTSGTVLQIQMYIKVYVQERAEVPITAGVTTGAWCHQLVFFFWLEIIYIPFLNYNEVPDTAIFLYFCDQSYQLVFLPETQQRQLQNDYAIPLSSSCPLV